MKIFECKCGSKEIFIKENGNNKGLYCADCGKWIQWLGKDDLRLAQRQIEQSIVNPIPRNLEELKEHDSLVRADVIDELLKILSPCYDCNACEEESKNYFQNSCMSEMLDYEEIVERAKQLKEKK